MTKKSDITWADIDAELGIGTPLSESAPPGSTGGITWADVDSISGHSASGARPIGVSESATSTAEKRSPRERMVDNFRQVGFNDRQSKLGAELMESKAYYGFADVATTLARGGSPMSGGTAPSPILTSRIAEMAKRIDIEEPGA